MTLYINTKHLFSGTFALFYCNSSKVNSIPFCLLRVKNFLSQHDKHKICNYIHTCNSNSETAHPAREQDSLPQAVTLLELLSVFYFSHLPLH